MPKDLDLFLLLLLQLAAILLTCRVVGWLGRRFLGQTQVVMEMVAGVMLGPSLFGLLAPQWQNALFPQKVTIAGESVRHPSMGILFCLSQLGLVLFMFLVGVEFDTTLLAKKTKAALAVSLSGIAAPFILGGLVGLALAGNTRFFGPQVTTWNGALYMGAAMCITAFPMLARIIYERGIAKTTMGTLALGAGASDDAVAWAVLAVVLAVNHGEAGYAINAIGGGALFAVVMLTAGKRLLARLGTWTEQEGRITTPIFLTTMLVVIVSAYITDAIGVYAVFGAFVAGAAMPREKFAEYIQKQLEIPVTVLFLPLFFVFSGLNTKIGLVDTPALWGLTGIICAAAIVGKGVACALAAKATGEAWRESWAIGILMNARGLMELIILNIALQAKIITPTLFTIMVIMAVVTTLMASPLFQWVYGKRSSSLPSGVEPAI